MCLGSKGSRVEAVEGQVGKAGVLSKPLSHPEPEKPPQLGCQPWTQSPQKADKEGLSGPFPHQWDKSPLGAFQGTHHLRAFAQAVLQGMCLSPSELVQRECHVPFLCSVHGTSPASLLLARPLSPYPSIQLPAVLGAC